MPDRPVYKLWTSVGDWRQRGLSLIELIAAVAVSSILLGMALPTMTGLYQQQRSITAINQLNLSVQFARHAAVTHGQRVTLCPSADGRHCSGRDQWHLGAIAFLDSNNNGQRDDGEVLLRAFPPLANGGRVYWRSFRNRSYLQMKPNGFTHWQNGSFLYCPPNGDARLARILIINAQGRARPAQQRNSDGIVLDARGRPVQCPG